MVGQPFLACFLLFAAVVITMEIGRRLGRNSEDTPGAGAVNGAIFAILGLVLAFSFSGAASRFDQRRDLIVQEANDIGTAYLRVDLAPLDAQPALRSAFKRYIDARSEAYASAGDDAAFRARLNKANKISQEIWDAAVAAGRRPDAQPAVNIMLLPAINAMIDITATRAFMTLMHPPEIIRLMLIALALVAALLAGIGFGGARRQVWVHELAFAVIMTMTIYITIDLEYPRAGFIRIDSFENAVIDFNRNK
ncbi:MAG: DUF4239 domain-containing protein [Sandarakinorhabdus sp.]|nr:DUF4239 domain-containing protein [Sandarakinorhabdus sp.]